MSSCPYHPSQTSPHYDQNLSLPASTQHAQIWSRLTNSTLPSSTSLSFPSASLVMSNVINQDYNTILTNKNDFISPGLPNYSLVRRKVLCANGAICTVKLTIFPSSDISRPAFTGGLAPGVHESGIMRLSTALLPNAPHDAKETTSLISGLTSTLTSPFNHIFSKPSLFPCVALKFMRQNKHSGNLLLGGKKTGQYSDYFFASTVCTNLTEKTSFALAWIFNIFRKYSKYPTQLGVSDFCAGEEEEEEEEEGVEGEEQNFPYCLALRPVISRSGTGEGEEEGGDDEEDEIEGNLASSFKNLFTGGGSKAKSKVERKGEDFLDELLKIPESTRLYDVYIIRSPNNIHEVEKIGHVTTTSSMKISSLDDELFFNHQMKEEDFEARPEWKEMVTSEHSNVGSSWFDGIIEKKGVK